MLTDFSASRTLCAAVEMTKLNPAEYIYQRKILRQEGQAFNQGTLSIVCGEKIYTHNRHCEIEKFKGAAHFNEFTHSQVWQNGKAQIRQDQRSHRHSRPR